MHIRMLNDQNIPCKLLCGNKMNKPLPKEVAVKKTFNYHTWLCLFYEMDGINILHLTISQNGQFHRWVITYRSSRDSQPTPWVYVCLNMKYFVHLWYQGFKIAITLSLHIHYLMISQGDSDRFDDYPIKFGNWTLKLELNKELSFYWTLHSYFVEHY